MFAIQPHLDDAVLGVGQQMLSYPGGTLVTVFAGTPYPYPPLIDRPHDDRCGFGHHDNPMAVRRAEDLDAMERIEWNATHLDLLDTQYRDNRARGQFDEELFYRGVLLAWGKADRPETVWCPAAISHPDHLWVLGQTVRFALEQKLKLMVWLEPGYRSFYIAASELAEATMVDVQRVPVAWGLAKAKLGLICCYASQLNGIAALALADALELEIYGEWGACA